MELKLTICIVASFADEALYIPVIEGTEPQAKASFASLLCTLDLFSASTPTFPPSFSGKKSVEELDITILMLRLTSHIPLTFVTLSLS